VTLHAVLSAKRALVLGVLRDLDLLHNLTKRSTISSGVLSADSDFLGSLSLLYYFGVCVCVRVCVCLIL